MKTTNKKSLKACRCFRSRVAAGRFELLTCGMCYGCRHGLPCARPYFAWFPF